MDIDTSKAAAALGRKGRAANTAAQAAAARENGKKGGRPPEPRNTYMICLGTDSTIHPPSYFTGTLKGAHRKAKSLLAEYEPDCRYILKVALVDAQGWKAWEEVQ